MKNIGILFIACLMPFWVCGQETTDSTIKSETFINKIKFTRANTLFNNLAYSQAAGFYEELVQARFKLAEVYPKLGDCYSFLNNTEKAEFYYYQAVTLDKSINPDYYYKYSKVLRSNGKYADSETWLNRYHEFFFTDSRVIAYNENKGDLSRLLNQKSGYVVKEKKELNSEFADFGAVPWKNKIVFTSGRTDNLYIGTYHAWNDKPFLDLYVYDSSLIVGKKITKLDNRINSKYHEGPLCFADTNSTLYFTRNNFYKGKRSNNEDGINQLVLFKSKFINGKWSAITTLPFSNKEYSTGHPCVTPDGKRLYFASNMPGTYGSSDIYYVDILENNQFGEPVNLGQILNTEGNEMYPFVDETGLYFSSDGLPGLGGLDVFYCKIFPDGELAKPVNLGIPLNSDKDDFCFFLHPGKRSGFLSSNRPGGTGDDDIYEFIISAVTLRGIVRDSTGNSSPLEKAEVKLSLLSGQLISKQETDSTGSFNFALDFDKNYMITVSKSGFKIKNKSLSTFGVTGNEIMHNMDMVKTEE